jgi:hypothetical protein
MGSYSTWLYHLFIKTFVYCIVICSVVVKALYCKPVGRGFKSRWGGCFKLTQSFRPHYGPGVNSTSNRTGYQESLKKSRNLGVKCGCVGFPPRRPGFKTGFGHVGYCDGQKWRWGRFSPRTSVSPANLHSIYFSTIIFIITRGWHNRPRVAAVPIASQSRIKKKKKCGWRVRLTTLPPSISRWGEP